MTSDGTGYREYRVAPATEALRSALIDFAIVERFDAALATGRYDDLFAR